MGKATTFALFNNRTPMNKKSILLIAVAIIVYTVTSQSQNLPSYLPTEGLVGWWPFNGNANDESDNGNNGTVNGATLTADRFGNTNKAYSFDGFNDFISTNYSGVLGTNNRSVSFWARHNNSFDPNQCASCSRKPVISYGSNVQGPSQIGKGFYCEFNIGLTGISFDGNETSVAYSTPSPVDDLNWHHYVYVFNNVTNSSSVKIYQDAILLTQLSYTYLPSSILNTLLGSNMDFGRRTYNQQGPTFYNGDLDDIGFWSTALTQQEITVLYSATNTTNNNQTSNTTANVPGAISYQAIARDAQGAPLADTNVQVRFTLLADSLSGAEEYVETHNLSTNSLGLFTTAFGAGTPVSNTFENINWSAGNKYLNVQVDTGNGLVDMGTQQLLSTPYSLYSAKAGEIKNPGLPVFSDNTAALAGGLVAGDMYRTSTGDLKIVY
jgi:hypothetical protein